MLLITHHLGFAKSAADQIIFMSEGKISEQGVPAILDKPRTERLSQFLSLARFGS
jgi:ABC-type histidine transport system ATPase subunit